LRYFGSFRGDSGRAWLLSITRNACWNVLEKRRSSLAATEFDETLHTPEPEHPEPEADLARSIAAEVVRRSLDALPLVFREVIVLRELEGLSYREIAEVTGVPAGTVMSRLARARAQLAQALQGAET
jgi:RNA polymerase sigma-70 factor (ECF subfamily)